MIAHYKNNNMSIAPPPSFTPSNKMGLNAIGNISAAPIEKGIHLRWGFDADLGFPAYGFLLYRRMSHGDRDGSFCIVISPTELATLLRENWVRDSEFQFAIFRYSLAPSPKSIGSELRHQHLSIAGPEQCRRFEIELDRPFLLRSISLQDVHGYVLVIGLNADKPVVSKEDLDGSSAEITFDLPMVDHILIYTRSDSGGPRSICCNDAVKFSAGGWSDNLLPAPRSPEFGFGLPLTHFDYNLHHRFENSADPAKGDLLEAEARVDSSGFTLVPDNFFELRSSLLSMVDSRIPGRMFDREVFHVADGEVPFYERPIDLSILFSLDPNMARILGLYFVDNEVEPNEAYDYLLIGQWAAWQLPSPGRVYSFASVPEGTYVPRFFGLAGVSVHLPTGGRIVSYPRDSGRPCRKALRTSRRGMFRFSSEPVRLRFNESLRWVMIEFGQRRDDLKIIMQNFGLEVGNTEIPAGDVPKHVLVRSGSQLFNELEIVGDSFDLYGLRTGTETFSEEQLNERVSLGTLLCNMRFIDAPALSPPSNLRLRGVAMPTSEQLADDLMNAGPPVHSEAQGLGLRWDPPPSPSVSASSWPVDFERCTPTEAVGYDLRYQFLGNNSTPEPIDPTGWEPALKEPIMISPPALPGKTRNRRSVAAGEDLLLRFPVARAPIQVEFPPEGDLWLQPWVPEGWYAASVRSRDVFGRESSWVDTGTTLADQLTPPPPPLNVRAKLLQANDPGLTQDEIALVSSHGDGCVRVTWDWPANVRRQAPHATHFRIYVKRRLFNRLMMNVSLPQSLPIPSQFGCTLETETPLLLNCLVGSNLIDRNGTPFVILANTSGGTSSNVTVKRHNADPQLIPTQGMGAVNIVDHIMVRVVSISSGPTITEFNVVIRSSLPFVAGSLANAKLTQEDESVFTVITNSAGANSTLTLERDPMNMEKLPARGQARISIAPSSNLYQNPANMTSWEARVVVVDLTDADSYQVVLAPMQIVASAMTPVRYASIGVSTADNSVRVEDKFEQPPGPPWDPALGNLQGREGGVSPPSIILAVNREELLAPPAPPRDRFYTSSPDFYGRCFYKFRWPNFELEGRSNRYWKVFRTTDLSLFALYNPDPIKSDIDVSGLSPTARLELESAFNNNMVTLISDELIQQLADQPGGERAFMIAHPESLRSMEDEMIFSDVMDGKNIVRYLYRLRSMDEAGNLSPFSPTSQPVHVPNAYPPTQVQVSGCYGGERQVTLKWIPKYEADLAGYLIFSTETDVKPDALEEMRLLRKPRDLEHGEIEAYDRSGNLIAPTQIITKAESETLLNEGQIVLIRSSLEGGKTFHYRIAAFDEAGNSSILTGIYTARTRGIERPTPPIWNPPVNQPEGLLLSWTLSTLDLNSLVQKSSDAHTWNNISSWLGRGVHQFLDTNRVEGTSYYRLRVMLPNGQINSEYTILEVAA